MKHSILAAGLPVAAALTLTGCASVNKSAAGYDLSKLDPHIELNKTTLAEVREMLGTPTALGKTADGNTVAGYALVGHNTGAVSRAISARAPSHSVWAQANTNLRSRIRCSSSRTTS